MRFDGSDREMSYLRRKVYLLEPTGFLRAGEQLHLRHSVIDVRLLPEEKVAKHTNPLDDSTANNAVGTEIELEELPQYKFNVVRINSFCLLKAILGSFDKDLANARSKSAAPYVFREPYTVLFQSSTYIERRIAELKAVTETLFLDKQLPSPDFTEDSKPANSSSADEDVPAVEHDGNAASSGDTDLANLPRDSAKEDDSGTSPTRSVEELPDRSCCIDCYKVSLRPDLLKLKKESESEREIRDLEFFLHFLEQIRKPHLERLESLRAPHCQSLFFQDLHDFFPLKEDLILAGYFNGSVRAFKLLSVGGGARVFECKGDREHVYRNRPFVLGCYYWDFDGSNFCAVREDITVPYFEGQVPVRKLPVFHHEYLTAAEKATLRNRGERFLQISKDSVLKVGTVQHKTYAGLSLEKSKDSYSHEYIEGEVIIDHSMAVQLKPHWKPISGGLDTLPDTKQYHLFGSASSRCIKTIEGRQSSLKAGWPGSYLKVRNADFMAMVCKQISSITESPFEKAAELLKTHALLMHNRVFAFVLRNRKWAQLNLQMVDDVIRGASDGFENLVLPEGHKDIVKAMVEMHSPLSSLSLDGTGPSSVQLDAVRGKGKGLIMLLHGAPGVGKTSTAESVAAYAQKPLFPLSCGDIGYEPKDVEENLTRNFRLANKWNCVMLLDEADVFLAQRQIHDMKRNSIVSVFLRVLEYFEGILLLTTNRVGAFDEAFKSRIHVSLHYPPLDHKACSEVWNINLRRLQQDKNTKIQIKKDEIQFFAREHYRTLQWNGRQIRNAFQTALALARYDSVHGSKTGEIGDEVELGYSHFEKVMNITMSFTTFMTDMYGATDADLAKTQQLRNDFAPGSVSTPSRAMQNPGPGYNNGTPQYSGYQQQGPYQRPPDPYSGYNQTPSGPAPGTNGGGFHGHGGYPSSNSPLPSQAYPQSDHGAYPGQDPSNSYPHPMNRNPQMSPQQQQPHYVTSAERPAAPRFSGSADVHGHGPESHPRNMQGPSSGIPNPYPAHGQADHNSPYRDPHIPPTRHAGHRPETPTREPMRAQQGGLQGYA